MNSTLHHVGASHEVSLFFRLTKYMYLKTDQDFNALTVNITESFFVTVSSRAFAVEHCVNCLLSAVVSELADSLDDYMLTLLQELSHLITRLLAHKVLNF